MREKHTPMIIINTRKSPYIFPVIEAKSAIKIDMPEKAKAVISRRSRTRSMIDNLNLILLYCFSFSKEDLPD